MRIEVIEGIGPAHASALQQAGVTHVRHLLQRAASASGRSALASETGLSPALLMEWLNHIDLMRIRGVGAEYSDLLEAAGVDSPVELAQRSPARLLAGVCILIVVVVLQLLAQYITSRDSGRLLSVLVWFSLELPTLLIGLSLLFRWTGKRRAGKLGVQGQGG